MTTSLYLPLFLRRAVRDIFTGRDGLLPLTDVCILTSGNTEKFCGSLWWL